MNTCERFEEAVSGYIDGELDDRAGAELFTHLGECSACRQTFAHMSGLRARIRSASEPSIPTRLDRRIARLGRPAPLRGSRFLNGVRRAWASRLTIPAPAFALALLLATVTILASLLLVKTSTATTGEQQVMYIMSIPAIEVEGVPNHSSSHIQ